MARARKSKIPFFSSADFSAGKNFTSIIGEHPTCLFHAKGVTFGNIGSNSAKTVVHREDLFRPNDSSMCLCLLC